MWTDESSRRDRLPANWEQIRRQVLDRDGWKCVWWLPNLRRRCGRPANQVDHKRAMEDDHRLEALQSLCEVHHRRKTAMEAGAAKNAKKASRYRSSETHPGALS